MKYLLLLSMLVLPALMANKPTAHPLAIYQDHNVDIQELWVDSSQVAGHIHKGDTFYMPWNLRNGIHHFVAVDSNGEILAYDYDVQAPFSGAPYGQLIYMTDFSPIYGPTIDECDDDHEHSCSATTSGGGLVLFGLLLLACVSYRRRVTA